MVSDETGTTLAEALRSALPGETIRVVGGTHAGPFVVTTPVTLVGTEGASLDGAGSGTVITLTAPGTTLTGLRITGTGDRHDRGDAAVKILADDCLVEGNHLEDVLFGIWIEDADGTTIQNNTIEGRSDLLLPRRGDGIRTWHSRGTTIGDNTIRDARDVVLWYSEETTVVRNTIQDSRYGVHMMYSHGADIEDNRILSNSVGAYIMYTRGVTLRGNLFEENRGDSGYGMAFKESDAIDARDNLFLGNDVGFYLDHTPFTGDGTAHYEDNVLVGNGAGMMILPSVHGAVFTRNTFWNNDDSVIVHGGGHVSDNVWEGNYWSDYTGFDADGDGRGDLPYRSQRLFEDMGRREPGVLALRHGPVIQALEFAAHSFPVIRPEARFQDPSPAMEPAALPAFAPQAPAPSALWVIPVAGLSVVGASAFAVPHVSARRKTRPGPVPGKAQQTLRIRAVHKQYGDTKVLEGIDLEVPPGQSLALWGTNGAGKTTLLKCILGQLRFAGSITVGPLDVRGDGQETRRLIGYVPQRLCLPDWTVETVMARFTQIKDARPGRGKELLVRLGLWEHRRKPAGALSGGLQQRLALALALLHDPPILLLDEPSASLDPASRQAHLDLLGGLREEGRTIIFATHRIEEVTALADHVAIIAEGRIHGRTDPGSLRLLVEDTPTLIVHVGDDDGDRAVAALQAEGIRVETRDDGLRFKAAPHVRRQALHRLREDGIALLDVEVMP